MNISLYLLVGFLLALPLAWRPNKVWQVILSVYWFILFGWALEIVRPFTYFPIRWSKSLDLSLSYQIDGLARLFALLISGIGILIFIYAASYAKNDLRKKAKLLSILQVFAISMLGIVLTDNSLVLFVAWELTSVTSYLLIQFDTSDKKANQAAFNSMFISVLGGLAMLAGLILLQYHVGSWSIQNTLKTLHQSQIILPAFWLLLAGAVTKSALFPFYFWLVGAMKAPAPVSAYLHSATMVNAGIYLLARFHPLFSLLSYWYPMLAIFGLSTMLISSILSLFQRDLKAILAYTTLFALGSMVYLLASKQWLAAQAFALFLLFHGLYKAAAFMWVGALDKTFKTRDIQDLQGVGRRWYTASFVAIIAFSAMAGLPPFFGFVLKEMIYEVKLLSTSTSYLSIAISMFSSMLIAAVSFKCLYYWFKGQPKVTPKKALPFILVAPFILVGIILVLELIVPHLSSLLSQAANSIIWSSVTYQCMHNNSLSIALSFITLGGGVLLFFMSQWLNRFSLNWPSFLNPLVLFEKGLEKFMRFGRWFTCQTQGQSLSKQFMVILSTLILWLAFAFYVSWPNWPSLKWQATSWPVTVLSLLLICIAMSLLFNYRFLINMVSLALLGLIMSGIFVLQGAPDVAMTQLLVEILTVIILVIALRKARFKHFTLTMRQKVLHATIAILVGLGVTLLLFMVTSTPFNGALSEYFIQNSLTKAYGRNVVNVILVDFRAFDTLGEALVVLASTLAIYLLIDKTRSFKEAKQKEN